MIKFLEGFYKAASLMKGQRPDKETGAKPRSMVSSKGHFSPTPLPSADNDATVGQHLQDEMKHDTMPHIKHTGSKINI